MFYSHFVESAAEFKKPQKIKVTSERILSILEKKNKNKNESIVFMRRDPVRIKFPHLEVMWVSLMDFSGTVITSFQWTIYNNYNQITFS